VDARNEMVAGADEEDGKPLLVGTEQSTEARWFGESGYLWTRFLLLLVLGERLRAPVLNW